LSLSLSVFVEKIITREDFFCPNLVQITFPKQFFTKKEQKSEETILLP
jgi:hypothetical protein